MNRRLVKRLAADPRRRARLSRWGLGAGVAATLATLLVATGAAQSVFTIFQPRQFTAVPVTEEDVAALAQLARYGHIGPIPALSITPQTSSAAAAAAGIPVPSVSSLPPGVPATPSVALISGATVSFTFDSGLAHQAAASSGATLPAMPSTIDGSSLELDVPPVIVEAFGVDIGAALRQGPAAIKGRAVLVAASALPVMRSTGASAQMIEDYVLEQPGIPADLAAELRAIRNPSTTLPVPIPVGVADAQSVSVNGASGLLIGDQTGAGSLVVWQRTGIVYAAVGSVSADDVLGVADSVH